jgi:hypothetical protein
VKPLAVALLAAAGCLTGTPGDPSDGYPVEAVALLAPLGSEPPSVDGPIEFLGTGMPGSVADAGARTIAAYHVHLAEGVDAFVELVNAASCTDREPLTSAEQPVAAQVLGLIRRVGDETHFFTPYVQIGDQIRDIDTETATAYAPRNAQFPRILLAISSFDFHLLACGELTWR